MTISIASVKSTARNQRAPRPRASLMTALTVWSERRTLANMDVSRLKDLGISPQDAAAEAARPFWDLPTQSGR